jgi:hypothetical protein
MKTIDCPHCGEKIDCHVDDLLIASNESFGIENKIIIDKFNELKEKYNQLLKDYHERK